LKNDKPVCLHENQDYKKKENNGKNQKASNVRSAAGGMISSLLGSLAPVFLLTLDSRVIIPVFMT